MDCTVLYHTLLDAPDKMDMDMDMDIQHKTEIKVENSVK